MSAVHAVGRGLAGLTAAERTLPVLPAFGALLPGCALRRGSVVACGGEGAITLAVSLAAGASQEGAWIGLAGAATVGCRALGELGIELGRVVLVAEPAGGFTEGRWAEVLSAMIDGFDVVLLGAGLPALRPAVARKLQARVQSRGAVLIIAGSAAAFAADVQFTGTQSRWQGLGRGYGVATARSVQIAVHGRRVPRATQCSMWLPGPDGALEPVAEQSGRLSRREAMAEATRIAG